MYSKSIDKLISELKKLPSVGPHTAERFVYYWLRQGKKPVTELMLALKNLIETVKSCEECYDFSDGSPCPTCLDPKRDQTTFCVVAEPWDKATLESTGVFKGRYFILRGTIDGADPESLNETKIPELLQKIKATKQETKEIVLALNPDMPGETTMMYLENAIKKIQPNMVVTRLARGLPLGADLRYADEITLSAALKNRTKK